MLSAYNSGFSATTLTIEGECTETIATTPVSCASASFSGCGFPNDENGLYFYLVADSSVQTETGGCDHCQNSFGGGTILPLFSTSFNNPSPNGDRGLDLMMSCEPHEITEYLTDPNGISGWHCAIGSPTDNEVCDLCQDYWGGGPWLGSVSGQPYNLTIGGTNYFVSSCWQPGLANGCFTQPPTTSASSLSDLGNILPCTTNGWVYGSQGPYCTVPTCNDGQKDGFETDVDCGGECPAYQVSGPLAPPNAGLCESGKKCAYFTDCASGTCMNTGTCL